MKNILSTLFLLMPLLCFGQKNFLQLGQLSYNEELSDVWGYVDTSGTEWALVGAYNGTSIVSLDNPTNPVEKFFIPGPNSTWRDLKVWDHYAYVVNETSGGLLIIDLQNLPNNINTYTWNGSGSVNFSSAHNVFIDENGFLYIIGSNYGVGGAIIADLNQNPTNPTLKTVYNAAYIHDLFVRGDTMWTAEINDGVFAVVDISDKSGPTIPLNKILATHPTPHNFTHNTWLSDDGNYLFTTDEKSGAYIAAYDVSDLGDIEETDRIQTTGSSNVIVHNTFYHNGFLFTSYYRDGVTVVDAHKPDNLVEVGYYDTSPLSGNGFNGAWGVYPYLPSGNILVTDIEQGLFVLSVDTLRAAYVEGYVKDSFCQSFVHAAQVKILGTNISTTTDIFGNFKTGSADTGVVLVEISKPGYLTDTIQVNLQRGVVANLNVTLVPATSSNLQVVLTDAVTGDSIANAKVYLESTSGGTVFDLTTNASGIAAECAFIPGTYTIYVGKWGYKTKAFTNITLMAGQNVVPIQLDQGYYDDFAIELGWSTGGSASSGHWERVKPAMTIYNGQIANVNNDVVSDLGNKAYVTGNDASGGAGGDDVDNGNVILNSPSFDVSSYSNPHISYYRWFYNSGGSGNPNDSLKVYLTNGTDTVLVDFIKDGGPESQWVHHQLKIRSFMTPSATMKVWFETADDANGHLVEAGVDVFTVFDTVIAPTANFSVKPLQTCAGSSITLTDESEDVPTTYTWTITGPQATTAQGKNPTITLTQPGTYTVKLVVANAAGTDSVTKSNQITVWDNPEVGVVISSPPSAGQNNGSATASATGGAAPYTFTWSTGASGATATGLSAGNYSVTVTDNNGCSHTVQFEVRTVGIAPTEGNVTISAYPNPFTEQLVLEIETPALEDLVIEIHSLTGQKVASEVVTATGKITISGIGEAGTYLVRLISAGEELKTIKVVKVE